MSPVRKTHHAHGMTIRSRERLHVDRRKLFEFEAIINQQTSIDFSHLTSGAFALAAISLGQPCRAIGPSSAADHETAFGFDNTDNDGLVGCSHDVRLRH